MALKRVTMRIINTDLSRTVIRQAPVSWSSLASEIGALMTTFTGVLAAEDGEPETGDVFSANVQLTIEEVDHE